MKAARFTSSHVGSLVIEETALPILGDKEILIKVAFTAVNRADTLQRKGSYPPPPGASVIIGLEVSGTVAALGPGAAKWRLGDEVMALLPGGGYAEFVAVREEHVMRVPAGMSLRQAAAIPEAWITGFQLLRFVGSVRKGDVVVVHAAASGVGTAVLQMLRLFGARAIATVGSDEKVNLCRQLGAERALNRKKDSDFAAVVNAMTNGRGADLILDCVGGSYWEQNAEALATDGTWIVYGLLGGAQITGPLLGTILRKRARILGTTLRTRSVEYKAELIAQFSSEVLPQFSSGHLQPQIFSERPLAEAGEAHADLEANIPMGKLLLRVAGEPAAAKQDL